MTTRPSPRLSPWSPQWLLPPRLLRRLIGALAAMLIVVPVAAQHSTAPAAKPGATGAKKKIYGGEAARKGAYPFMVSVFKSDAKATEAGIHGAHFCGGSMIRQRWVLTAAHCMYELDQNPPRARAPADINVYVGSNVFKGGQRIKVRRIIVHPQYDIEQGPDFDIALLELAEAPAPGRTALITLATPQTEKDYGVPGKTVTAAGWGENEDGEFPKTLMEVRLQIVETGTCNANVLAWRRNQWFENQVAGLRAKLSLSEETVQQMRKLLDSSPHEQVITENMICSGQFATRQDTCVGDSGGPLFAEAGKGRFVQIGLTSFAEAGCGMGEQGLFGVYTRVSRFIEWIDETAR
ncbi:MAG: serine protease [Hyphomicrobiales bacterium]|nr:serine protease [Hyphomicrobiales bacterium]